MDQPVEQQSSNNSKRGALIAVIALVAVVALAFAAYSFLGSAAEPEPALAATPYELDTAASSNAEADAANLSCEILGFDGKALALADVAADGKPLIVNLWATWCPYCVAEMQDFQTLYDKYGDRAHFVMLNVYDSQREELLAKEYIADGGFTFPVYYDASHQVKKLLAVVGYPTTAVFSPQGQILMNRAGQIDYDTMDATIATVLSNS